MALSNWDTLSFNEKGESTNGCLRREDGSRVEIYKNWIYVYGVNQEGKGNHAPLASIDHGKMDVSGFKIIADRHEDQQAVFVFAECLESKTTMVGIGCYGYSDTTSDLAAHLGIDVTAFDAVWQYSEFDGDNHSIGIHAFKGEDMIERSIPDDGTFESKWIGVSEKTLNAFYTWLETVVSESFVLDKDFVKKCRAGKAMRFNQGDAYFANKIGGSLSDIGSEVEQANTPFLMQMLKPTSES